VVQYIYFRQGEVTDLPTLEALLSSEQLPATDIQPEEFVVAVHERDGRILGCGRVHASGGGFELSDLVVASEHRAQGIGQFLARRILEKRREPIHVVTRRMDIRFFETLGFRAVPESEAPAWLLERRDTLQKILPESSLVFGVRDASVVSF
jgi:N-acetylglutamate synthase-like GNAT family acetyltransferase